MSVILYEKKNGIGIITLNRPEKRNALNSAMINGLGQYLHEAADDSDVKVIVIRAEGEKAFTAGFDLKETIFYKGIMPSETGFRFSSGL